MNQQTYEIIAKYIADKTGLAIQWHDEGICPQADIKGNVIHLPLNVHDEKVYSALSLLMHEAAHLKYSMMKPKRNGQKISLLFTAVWLNVSSTVRILTRNSKILKQQKR